MAKFKVGDFVLYVQKAFVLKGPIALHKYKAKVVQGETEVPGKIPIVFEGDTTALIHHYVPIETLEFDTLEYIKDKKSEDI